MTKPTVAKIWFSEERQRWEGVCDNTSTLHHNESLRGLKVELANEFGFDVLVWRVKVTTHNHAHLLGYLP